MVFAASGMVAVAERDVGVAVQCSLACSSVSLFFVHAQRGAPIAHPSLWYSGFVSALHGFRSGDLPLQASTVYSRMIQVCVPFS